MALDWKGTYQGVLTNIVARKFSNKKDGLANITSRPEVALHRLHTINHCGRLAERPIPSRELLVAKITIIINSYELTVAC